MMNKHENATPDMPDAVYMDSHLPKYLVGLEMRICKSDTKYIHEDLVNLKTESIPISEIKGLMEQYKKGKEIALKQKRLDMVDWIQTFIDSLQKPNRQSKGREKWWVRKRNI